VFALFNSAFKSAFVCALFRCYVASSRVLHRARVLGLVHIMADWGLDTDSVSEKPGMCSTIRQFVAYRCLDIWILQNPPTSMGVGDSVALA